MASCAALTTRSSFSTSNSRHSAAQLQRRPVSGAAPARGARLLVRAAVKPPSGVTLPPVKPEVPPPKFGFVDNAERINSRAAMIGFFALLLVEAILNQGILEFLGIGTGKGL